MFTKEELIDFCEKARENYLDHISIDCVVFGFHEGQLKVLTLKMKKEPLWYLPGGFILKNEPIEIAANRILKDRTGLDNIFLQQFHVFGDPDRSKPHGNLYNDMLPPGENWLSNRFLTIGYYALVDFSNVTPTPDYHSESCKWYDLAELPDLILDHSLILKKALDTLRLQLNYQPIGYNLMPGEFTMPELQKLYETILDKKLDRRNFQRRMLGFGILNRLELPRKGGAHKAPYLYTFDMENCQEALKEGLKGGW
ncbi:MAG: NUDIX domain-containing protein [Mucilaginibacter sp.]